MNYPVPSDVAMPHTGQTLLLVLMAALALASVTYAVVESRRRGDLFLIFLVIGAGLAIPYEALGDDLVHVYYTELGQVTWIHTFGRDIPAFIGILYFWYLPFGAYALLRKARTGVSRQNFWIAWLATLTFCVGIAAGVCGLERLLSRKHQWMLIPAVPMLMFATQGMTSLPLAVSLHSGTTNQLYLSVGALGTGAFAVVLAWIVSEGVRNPWARPTEATAQVAAHSAARNI